MYNSDNRYILMNKDRPIAALDVGMNIAVIKEIYGDIPGYIGNFYKWIESRTTLFGRKNILELAKLAGISNEYEFLTISKAISITDTLWVNDLKFPTTWDKVSPYRNRISRIMAEIAINGMGNYNNQNLESPSPQYRVDGSVDKCIKRVNNELFLYKTDGARENDLLGARPYSEYYASIVAKQLGLSDYVKYGLTIHTTEKGYLKPYCYCKLFTNENEGLVAYGESVHRDKSLIELDNMVRQNRPDISNSIREMIILDSIILNPDRHSGNYGFIFNTDNYRLLKFAPIYDNDCSLGSLIAIRGYRYEDRYNEIMQYKQPRTNIGNYNEQAKWAMTLSIYNKLKNCGHISLGEKLNGISDERFGFMEYLVNRRRQELLSLFE